MKGIELCAECAYYNMKSHKCTRGCKIDPDSKKGEDVRFFVDCPLPDVQPVTHWISIKDRLPVEDESVLIYTFTGARYVATRFDNRFFVGATASFVKEDVTHWMPLPEPPKDGDADA